MRLIATNFRKNWKVYEISSICTPMIYIKISVNNSLYFWIKNKRITVFFYFFRSHS